MSHTPKVQVSCLAIHDHQVVLIKRLDPESVTYNQFIPPGGHVENLESLEQTCIREMAEETGLQVSALELRGVVTFLMHTAHDHAVCFFFVAHDVKGQLAINEPTKLHPYWIPVVNIQSHPDIPNYYKQIIAHLLGNQDFLNARVEWRTPDNRVIFSIVEGSEVLV